MKFPSLQIVTTFVVGYLYLGVERHALIHAESPEEAVWNAIHKLALAADSTPALWVPAQNGHADYTYSM